jgi:hypothetical protein
MQRILAIAGLTWKAALRFKLFLVIAVLLVLAVVGLPLIIRTDGSAEGFTQIILTYTLSAITALLGFSTLWLSCGTLARDIEEGQIQVLATKPVARWQIWLGKWLGIVSLNAALLAISGGCVFGLLQWRASRQPAAVQRVLHEQIMVSRGSAKEPSSVAAIDAATDQVLQQKLKSTPVEQVNLPEVRRQIREMVSANWQLVPPGYTRTWHINLGAAKNYLHGRPLQLRVKFNTADRSPSGTFDALWMVGNPPKTKYWRTEEDSPMSLAPDTFHEFSIPADLYDQDGILTITFMNPNPTALLFPLNEGMEVLYPESSFGLNFIRGLGIIFCWMALLSALGLAAASLLSFPVAAFFSLAMMLVVLSSGMLAESVDNGTVAAGNEETGQRGHTVVDGVLIPAFRGVLAVVNVVKDFSPIDALSTGRSITWSELGLAFVQIVGVMGGAFAVVGIIFFSRRELATAQGIQ